MSTASTVCKDGRKSDGSLFSSSMSSASTLGKDSQKYDGSRCSSSMSSASTLCKDSQTCDGSQQSPLISTLDMNANFFISCGQSGGGKDSQECDGSRFSTSSTASVWEFGGYFGKHDEFVFTDRIRDDLDFQDTHSLISPSTRNILSEYGGLDYTPDSWTGTNWDPYFPMISHVMTLYIIPPQPHRRISEITMMTFITQITTVLKKSRISKIAHMTRCRPQCI